MEVVNNMALFQALGIKTEAEIMMLKKCFLPYAKCSVCSTPMEEKMTTMFRGSHESIGRCVVICINYKIHNCFFFRLVFSSYIFLTYVPKI
jgi:hypothetical protein